MNALFAQGFRFLIRQRLCPRGKEMARIAPIQVPVARSSGLSSAATAELLWR
jgi:hypothetical protein